MNRRIATLLVVLTACSFPRPADVASNSDGDDDTPTGCASAEDCSRSTPFCIDTVCAVCKTDDACPAAEPVCDQTSHDCRTCLKDAECDSGACDLAAGTCVEQGKILYAAPGGTTADPCTRTRPCSFPQAATMVDASRPYIVLGPGRYTETANFGGQTAVICSRDGAIYEPDDAYININSGSSIWFRNFKTVPGHAATAEFGMRLVFISAANSTVRIDDSDLDLSLPNVIMGGNDITIQNTRLSHGLVQPFGGRLTVDRSTFVGGAGILMLSGDKVLTVLNSVFISSSGVNALRIGPDGNTDSLTRAFITNNTFIAGGISCNGSQSIGKTFASNIFYNINQPQEKSDCLYLNNLMFPSYPVVGQGNIAKDPLFVDAAHNDFHLTAGSPAIDAGYPYQDPNGHDRDGKPRPPGFQVDLGAYEYGP